VGGHADMAWHASPSSASPWASSETFKSSVLKFSPKNYYWGAAKNFSPKITSLHSRSLIINSQIIQNWPHQQLWALTCHVCPLMRSMHHIWLHSSHSHTHFHVTLAHMSTRGWRGWGATHMWME
jgi:hypothetical protein